MRPFSGKVAYRGTFTPEDNDALVASIARIGLWFDTSDQQADETVEEILLRQNESLTE